MVIRHILPYSECTNVDDMIDHNNGLLLCPLHDSLFDKNMISFSQTGDICISKSIDDHFYKTLNINEDFRLSDVYLTEKRKKYLLSHYDQFIKNELEYNLDFDDSDDDIIFE